MRHLALAIAAVLSLALVAPAFAQPFADVPADHWAFDAIAELAAKGILEGFPDGTFKGDRAMTRYEMAMALARILARIEAIKIPPPPPPVKIPPPEVTRADIDRLTRLINEFRAELSALGVRITAVEEELAALKARLDNTKVTGDVRFRYNVFPTTTPPGVGGSATNRAPDIRMRARITFTGQVSPDVKATVRLWAANNAGCRLSNDVAGPPAETGECLAGAGTNFDVRFGNTSLFNNVSFDYLYLDVQTGFGLPMSWRVGRQPVSLGGSFGPYRVGLLFDEGNLSSLTGVNDGVTVKTSLGPLSLFAFALQENVIDVSPGLGGAPSIKYYAVRGTYPLLPGWTVGLSWYTERFAPATVAPGGSLTRGTGWSADISGTLIPGIDWFFDYASWTYSVPTPAIGASAWRTGANINLSQFGVTQWSPMLAVWYDNFGSSGTAPGNLIGAGGLPPMRSYACTLNFLAAGGACWDWQGWGVDLTATFSPKLDGGIMYQSGNVKSTGATVTELFARLNYSLATRTTLTLQYLRGQSPAGTDNTNFYRLQLTYSW